MSVSKRDQNLLLILLGVAALLVVYLMVFKPYNAKSAELQAQIDTLTPRLTELRDYSANLGEYQQKIDEIGGSVAEQLQSYPADLRSEDLILYANELKNKLGLELTGVTANPPELVAQFSLPKKSGETFTLVPVAALRTGLDIACGLDYDQFKKLLTYIYATKQKTALTSVDLSYNATTGSLSAAVSMEKFFVSSMDYIYEKTDIPGITQGVDDPFGTVAVVSGQEEEDEPVQIE